MLICALSLLVLPAAAQREFRGLWVDAFGAGFTNSEEVTKLAEDCRRYNFNAVVVEMRRRGDAFYMPHAPNKDPRTTVLADDFDALAEIIKECHSRTPRIEVHCWLVSHFIWSGTNAPSQAGHILNLHPEYLTKDSIGQKWMGNGYYLDPGQPEANQWIHDTAADIVSHYDVDGLHWDYCRYPNQNSGYNEVALERYKTETGAGIDPRPNDPQFSDWRRRQVTDFLRWVNADLLAIKPSLVISIAVFADYKDAYGYRFSDWACWNREGIVDICMPMNFSPAARNLFIPRVKYSLENRGKREIYMGLGGFMNQKDASLGQLTYAREAGFAGTVFYSYRSPNEGERNPDGVFALIKRDFQPQWTDTPVLPWKKNRAVLKGTVLRKDSGTPVYNAVVSLDCESSSKQILKTEPHGKFAFFDVPAGSHTVSVLASGLGGQSRNLNIDSGQIETVDFSLFK
jgi:uncharacterized lipoprotein YddW (UPF0748 family)